MSAINKGRTAEREVVNMLQPILDYCWGTVKLQAPQLQRRGLGFSGEDIIGLSWLSLEVKRRETLALDKWWEQCIAQAQRRNGGMVECALVYRQNNKPWRVRMHGIAGQVIVRPCIVDIAWQDFEWWFYYNCMKEVDKECDARAR